LKLAGDSHKKARKTQKRKRSILASLCFCAFLWLSLELPPVCAAAFAVAKLSFTNIPAHKRSVIMDIETTANAESQAATPAPEQRHSDQGAEQPAEQQPQQEAEHQEEISYHAVEKSGKITAIWEMRGRKHIRTIDPRSEEGRHLLGSTDNPEAVQNAQV